MEFIGKDGVSAPLVRVKPPKDPAKIYESLLSSLERLYCKAELVHGDLSEYNVMIWKNKPVIFDMSQSVSIYHPMARFLLQRDITNLNRFFNKLGVNVSPNEEVYTKVTCHGKT